MYSFFFYKRRHPEYDLDHFRTLIGSVHLIQVLTLFFQQLLLFVSILYVGHISGHSLELDSAGELTNESSTNHDHALLKTYLPH